MSRRTAVLGAAVASLLLAAPARAASDVPWSLDSGKTVGTGNTVFWGQAGFPGVFLELIHGIDPLTEIGGFLALDYGQGGIVDHCCNFGMNFQFHIRRNFFDNGKMSIAGSFDPGILLFFPSGTTQFGLNFPVGVQFGFPINPRVMVNGTFDLAMYAVFENGGYPGYFALPILFGGGIEYFAMRNLVLTFQFKLGPTILTYSGASAEFTLVALVGVAYKF